MPSLTKVLSEEDFKAAPRGVNLDLTPYLALIDTITRDRGVGATVKLSAEESQRTEKRRLTMAARLRGYQLRWRQSGPGSLRFVLAAEGEPFPGGRTRRTPPPAAPARATTRRRGGRA
jgi:hypothetical protein